MKKDFLAIFLTGLLLGIVGCNTDSPANNSGQKTTNTTNATASPANANANSGNSNSANTNTANPNSANANAAKKVEVPTFTDAPTALAEANKLFDANKEADSIEYFKQAVKLDPNLAEAHFKLGMAYSLVEKDEKNEKKASEIKKEEDKAFGDAVKAYQKILAKNPKDDVAQFNLGRSYNRLNKDKEAESAIRKAASMKPKDAEYQTELGAILIKFAKYPEAIGVLKKAQKLDLQNSRATDLLERAEDGKKREESGRPKQDK